MVDDVKSRPFKGKDTNASLNMYLLFSVGIQFVVDRGVIAVPYFNVTDSETVEHDPDKFI